MSCFATKNENRVKIGSRLGQDVHLVFGRAHFIAAGGAPDNIIGWAGVTQADAHLATADACSYGLSILRAPAMRLAVDA